MTEGAARQRSNEYKPQPKDELGEGTYASKQVTGEANIRIDTPVSEKTEGALLLSGKSL